MAKQQHISNVLFVNESIWTDVHRVYLLNSDNETDLKSVQANSKHIWFGFDCFCVIFKSAI